MYEHQGINISEELRRRLEEIALTGEDYNCIVSRLGREPNELELEIFGASWCEHSGYRHSLPLLRFFFDGVNDTFKVKEATS